MFINHFIFPSYQPHVALTVVYGPGCLYVFLGTFQFSAILCNICSRNIKPPLTPVRTIPPRYLNSHRSFWVSFATFPSTRLLKRYCISKPPMLDRKLTSICVAPSEISAELCSNVVCPVMLTREGPNVCRLCVTKHVLLTKAWWVPATRHRL